MLLHRSPKTERLTRLQVIMTEEWPPLLPLLLLPRQIFFWNLILVNNNIGRNVWTNESPNTIGLSLVSNYFFPGPPRAWDHFHFYIDFKLKSTCWKPVLCRAAWKECIEFLLQQQNVAHFFIAKQFCNHQFHLDIFWTIQVCGLFWNQLANISNRGTERRHHKENQITLLCF